MLSMCSHTGTVRRTAGSAFWENTVHVHNLLNEGVLHCSYIKLLVNNWLLAFIVKFFIKPTDGIMARGKKHFALIK